MMNLSSDIIEASYVFCRRLSRRSGSNFYLGFLLLPREKQRAMHALYAFMRHTDDLVDCAEGAVNQKREQLERWRSVLTDAFQGGGDSSRISARTMPEHDSPAMSLLPALVDTVHKYHIPAEYLYVVLDGLEMDLDWRRYETFEELQLYCRRVASAVGLACIHIWGFRGQGTPEGEAVFEAAYQAGIALQMTNILRDIKADAAVDRIYLPLEDLRSCGYSVEELKMGVTNEAFFRLMEMEINRARKLYQDGCKLFDFLNRDGQRIFGLMMNVYRSLLEKIARRPGDVFSRPIRMGKFERLVLFLYWTLIPSIMAEKKIRGTIGGEP